MTSAMGHKVTVGQGLCTLSVSSPWVLVRNAHSQAPLQTSGIRTTEASARQDVIPGLPDVSYGFSSIISTELGATRVGFGAKGTWFRSQHHC